MELIVENIRCFAERQTIPVKPLTLLVGENSAGKSTFLAALSAVSAQLGFPLRPQFNNAPYNLGNYDTIATFRGGRGGRAKSFSLGYNIHLADGEDNLRVVATYHDSNGSVELEHVDVASQTSRLQIMTLADKPSQIVLTHEKNGIVRIYENDKSIPEHLILLLGLPEMPYYINFTPRSVEDEQTKKKPQRLMDIDARFAELLLNVRLPRTLSVAPIRTKPERTYNEVVEEFSPEGEHIPFVLDDVLQDAEMRAVLEQFGAESGLFSRVAVKQWGRKRSDPIQVMVTNTGQPAANLTDVGYGVSQALPLVVQSVLAAPKSRLLLQQPEVHLHPRAQAALGTLFVDLLASNDKQFVVETHSDYILDRVRQEVARGKVAAGDVSILYFEREKNGTRIYTISVDNAGNIVNAPPSYRAFFLQEEVNLLTRANKNGARK